jgi:hypothetical protein
MPTDAVTDPHPRNSAVGLVAERTIAARDSFFIVFEPALFSKNCVVLQLTYNIHQVLPVTRQLEHYSLSDQADLASAAVSKYGLVMKSVATRPTAVSHELNL